MDDLGKYTPEETKLLIPIEEREVAMYIIRAAHRLLTRTENDVHAEKKSEGFDPDTNRWIFYYWVGYAAGVGFRASNSAPLDTLMGIAKRSVDKNRQIITEYVRGFEDGMNCMFEVSSSTYGPADEFADRDIEEEVNKILNIN